MTPFVAWTTEASNDLDAYGQRIEPAGEERPTRASIGAQLARALPGEACLIVRRVFVGFRPRADTQIVLVDTGDGTFIAKLGPADRLQREYRAYDEATPRGFDGDAVFLRLSRIPSAEAVAALRYQTAEAKIALPDTRSLEEVFLGAVMHQSPTPASIVEVLNELFAALAGNCYRYGGAQLVPILDGGDIGLNPSAVTGERHGLADSLEAWQREPESVDVRHDANAAFPIRAQQPIFRDPVQFFEALRAALRAVPQDEGRAARLRPLVPVVLVGRAHGDVHGRNVIVGVRNNAACRPSLFDYETMSPRNLIAWDFVKLETELKIRAANLVWPGSTMRSFAWELGQFETELAERTEVCRRNEHWPAAGGATGRERLLHLLLAIRRLAAQHLGRERSGEWLHEYYFLLGAYGVHSVRFRNPSARQRMAGYVCAGVALSRYEWGQPAPRPGDQLQEVWKQNRSSDTADRPRVIAQAQQILAQHRHDVHAWYELAYAQVRADRWADALATLASADREFRGQLTEDLFCLWGRYHKHRGEAALQRAAAEPDLDRQRTHWLQAETDFELAAGQYDRAAALERNHFPCINLAHLDVLRAALANRLGHPEHATLLASAKRRAQDLLASHAVRPWLAKLADDAIWIPATLGEANLICEHWTAAADAYRRALAQPTLQASQRQSMGAQAIRLLNAFRELGVEPPAPFANPDAFFHHA